MAIIGLDVGTTGCKCIVFSEQGQKRAYVYEEYSRDLSSTTINAETIWQAVCCVINKANRQYNDSKKNPNPSIETGFQKGESADDDLADSSSSRSKAEDLSVKAISISAFGESFVPVNHSGEALSDIMLNTDPRGKKECEEFLTVLPEEEIMRSCGVKPHPMYSLPKIAWIRRNQPDVFAKTWKFLLIEDYIIYKLCGNALIDYSLASRTMGFDVANKCWDKKLLSLAGIDESKLSSAVPSGTIVGVIKGSLAEQFGLPHDVKVVTGGHDQVCAAIGAGVVTPGTAIDGIGTVECITTVFTSPVLSSGFLNNNYACVPYVIPGMYATYAFNFTGGALLKWFRDHFAAKEEMEAKAAGKSVYQILDEKAAKHPTSVCVIPHFAGSGTPDMDPFAAGSISGLTFQHGIPEIYRALLEGVTFEMKYNMDILRSVGLDITELRAVGGGAKSRLWLEIKAAITGCRILQLEEDEAGITGAAMIAGVAVGIFPSLKEAGEAFIKIKAVIEPDPALTRIYEKLFFKYKYLRNNQYND